MLYIAMRYVPGGDMRTMVRRDGPLPPGRAAAVIAQVASALDAAHAAGLVHRDVKPANMLVDRRSNRSDHVYLADFGLSKKRLAASAGLTGTGQFVGTLDYSAPEQIRGRPADGRTDQYALACAAFELLTGAPPFHHEEATAVMYAHLSGPPPPVTSRGLASPRCGSGGCPCPGQGSSCPLRQLPGIRGCLASSARHPIAELPPRGIRRASTQPPADPDRPGERRVRPAARIRCQPRQPGRRAPRMPKPTCRAEISISRPRRLRRIRPHLFPRRHPHRRTRLPVTLRPGQTLAQNGTATPGPPARNDHQRLLELGPVRRSTIFFRPGLNGAAVACGCGC